MYRKNTGGQFLCFQGTDSTTGGIKSGVTWTGRRCIDGTFAAVSATISEDGTAGWYKAALTAGDVNGNNISFNFTGTGAVPMTVNIITDGSPPDVNLKNAAGTAVTLDANNVLNVSTKYLAGTTQTARDIGASVLLSTGTGTGQLDFTSGVVKSNSTQWLGGTIPAVNITGVPLVDAKYLLGTVFATPATAGILDANIKNMNNVAATAITTVKAVQGLTTADTIATYTGNIPQTGDTFARIGVAGVGLTNLGDTRIANLDAAVSSRSTYAGGAVASVTAGVTVTTNNDKTGYALTASYDLAKTASQAGDAMALTSNERNSAADALLNRNVGAGSSAGRLVKEALYVLRNKTAISAGTLTVYGTDDTTSAFTADVTTAAGNPVTSIDPS